MERWTFPVMTSGKKKKNWDVRIFLSKFGFAIFPLFSFITKEVKQKSKQKKERMEKREAEEENHFPRDLILCLQQGTFPWKYLLLF